MYTIVTRDMNTIMNKIQFQINRGEKWRKRWKMRSWKMGQSHLPRNFRKSNGFLRYSVFTSAQAAQAEGFSSLHDYKGGEGRYSRHKTRNV